MKAYLLKVAATMLVIMLSHYLVLCAIRSPIPAEYWLREFIIVKRYQAAAMPSPKLIFIGGSCTLFGINAAEVQKSLGIPAINFGLHAGLRLEDHLDLARSVAKPGDIVILSLEPAYFDYYTATWTTWNLRNALAWNRGSIDGLPLPRRLRTYFASSDLSISSDLLEADIMQHVAPAYLSRREEALASEPAIIAHYLSERQKSRAFAYDVSNLDDNGDILNTRNSGPLFRGDTWSPTRPSSISPYAEGLLVPFLAEMKSRRVYVLFDYTPYLVYKKPEDGWRRDEIRFQGEIHRIGGELLEKRDAFFYPNTFFLNSNLHLNEHGREVRTQVLIEALRKKLNSTAIIASH